MPNGQKKSLPDRSDTSPILQTGEDKPESRQKDKQTNIHKDTQTEYMYIVAMQLMIKPTN